MTHKKPHTDELAEKAQDIPVEASACDCDDPNCDCHRKDEELAEYKEKLQRLFADTENNRKRAEVEKQQFQKFALEGFIEELLPVIDNFYRATEHVPEEQKNSPWVTGISYIQKNLLDVLEAHGVKEMQVNPGDRFNPSLHEAIGVESSEDLPDDHISKVQTRGYLLHERVLRPAQVIVNHQNQ